MFKINEGIAFEFVELRHYTKEYQKKSKRHMKTLFDKCIFSTCSIVYSNIKLFYMFFWLRQELKDSEQLIFIPLRSIPGLSQVFRSSMYNYQMHFNVNVKC